MIETALTQKKVEEYTACPHTAQPLKEDQSSLFLSSNYPDSYYHLKAKRRHFALFYKDCQTKAVHPTALRIHSVNCLKYIRRTLFLLQSVFLASGSVFLSFQVPQRASEFLLPHHHISH